MAEILYGVIGMCLVLTAFVGGWILGRKDREQRTPLAPQEISELSPEQIRQKRSELREQQAAFQMMQNYNADMAYGMTDGAVRRVE